MKKNIYLFLLIFISSFSYSGIWDFLKGYPDDEDACELEKRDLSPEEEDLAQRAAKIYFKVSDQESLKTMTLNASLMRHLAPRISGARKSLRTVLSQMEEGNSKSEEEIYQKTPVFYDFSEDTHDKKVLSAEDVYELKKAMHEIVTESIEEAFIEKERRITVQRKIIASQQNKVKMATIGAGATVCSTLLATIGTLVIFFVER